MAIVLSQICEPRQMAGKIMLCMCCFYQRAGQRMRVRDNRVCFANDQSNGVAKVLIWFKGIVFVDFIYILNQKRFWSIWIQQFWVQQFWSNSVPPLTVGKGSVSKTRIWSTFPRLSLLPWTLNMTRNSRYDQYQLRMYNKRRCLFSKYRYTVASDLNFNSQLFKRKGLKTKFMHHFNTMPNDLSPNVWRSRILR